MLPGKRVVGGFSAVAAGTALALHSDTPVPEALEATHNATGLVTVIGFLVAFVLSKLGG